MKYIDPLPVKCVDCDQKYAYAVKDLLSQQVLCKSCGRSLSYVGKEMQSNIDEWTAYLLKVELAIEVENIIKPLTLTDDELEEMGKVKDLIQLIQHRARMKSDKAERAVLVAINSLRSRNKSQSISSLPNELKFNEIY